MPIIAPTWTRITRIGPWLRGERYKRYYGGDFTNNGYVKGFRKWWLLHFHKEDIVIEQGMEDFFLPFLKDQAIVRRALYSIINSEIVRCIDEIADAEVNGYIGVHVRRGDFAKAGCKTDDEWFLKAVSAAIELDDAKGCSSIRIFSDGYPEELDFLRQEFKSKNIIIMPKAPAIQDILMLSRSKVLVCSPRSTFSMWGVFLGQMPSVWKKGSGLEPPTLYVYGPKEVYVP
jgi:hypothetical protein